MDAVVEALEGQIAPMECFHDTPEGKVLCSHEDDGDQRLLDEAAVDARAGRRHQGARRAPPWPSWSRVLFASPLENRTGSAGGAPGITDLFGRI